MTRLLDGFNYFWNLKPSQVTPVTLIHLHEWQRLLKESVSKKEAEPIKEEDMETMVKKIFEISA